MKLRVSKIIFALFAAALVFFQSISVSAAKLKIGSVEGLPEKLVVLDDRGQSVSENGEYFFEVEDMKAGETYTKNIQLMNLREDATYAIFFNAEPLESHGEIDLEEECKCDIRLNDNLVYTGKVTGEGNPDIREEALYLGYFRPGDSKVLTVDITWVDSGAGGAIDHGARVVDHNGTSIVREESGKKHISGETLFKWIFTASVIESYEEESDFPSIISEPESSDSEDSHSTSTVSELSDQGSTTSGGAGSDPGKPSVPGKKGGGNNIIDFVKTGDTIIYIAIGIVTVAMMFMIVLFLGKRKKEQKKKKSKKSEK